MINIIEKQTSKVPGLTSLFFSFRYNKDLIEDIKTLPCFNYSKKTNEWEIPILYLGELIDILCVYDDIDIRFCNIKQKEDTKYRLSKYKTQPFEYQKEGIQFGLNNDKFLLLDVPGLGKTLQIIYIAEERYKRKEIQHCLVVCGVNSLKVNWEKEINKHSKLSCKILGKKVSSKGNVSYGSIPKRLDELKHKIKEFFVITNLETLRDDKIIKAILKGPNKFDMIVVDEIHTCKNSSSKQGSNLLKLNKAKYLIGATGTLLLNNPMDSYVPLRWIGADKATKTNFDRYYCTYGGPFGNELIGFKNLDTLKDQLDIYSIRRHKNLLDLPPKTVINQYVEMDDVQNKFYNDVKDGVKSEVDKVVLKPNIIMGMILRLRQATACPSILSSKNIPSAKIERTRELCKEIVEEDNKVVIFSTFKQTVEELKNKLIEYNPVIGTGDIKDEELSKNIDNFQNNDENKIFIGTWQRCGTGLTLNKASYMIFIDTPWTDASFQQACDRIHRIGSKNPVFIYNLITTNTIDEKVLEIVEDKAAISNFIIDNEITEKSLKSLQKYIEELR